MSSFRDLQEIYESSYNPAFNKNYSGDPGGTHSFGKGRIPMATPGSDASQHNRGVAGNYNMPTVNIIADDEEDWVKDKQIPLSVVLQILDKEIEEAQTLQEDTLVFNLARIKKRLMYYGKRH